MSHATWGQQTLQMTYNVPITMSPWIEKQWPLQYGWADGLLSLDAGSNKNIKDIEILLKRNWNFPKHIFNKKY